MNLKRQYSSEHWNSLGYLKTMESEISNKMLLSNWLRGLIIGQKNDKILDDLREACGANRSLASYIDFPKDVGKVLFQERVKGYRSLINKFNKKLDEYCSNFGSSGLDENSLSMQDARFFDCLLGIQAEELSSFLYNNDTTIPRLRHIGDHYGVRAVCHNSGQAFGLIGLIKDAFGNNVCVEIQDGQYQYFITKVEVYSNAYDGDPLSFSQPLNRIVEKWNRPCEIKPKTSGYSSVHINGFLRQVGQTRQEDLWLPVELQVRNLLEHAWAEIEHALRYKSSDRDGIEPMWQPILNSAKTLCDGVASLFLQVEGLKNEYYGINPNETLRYITSGEVRVRAISMIKSQEQPLIQEAGRKFENIIKIISNINSTRSAHISDDTKVKYSQLVKELRRVRAACQEISDEKVPGDSLNRTIGYFLSAELAHAIALSPNDDDQEALELYQQLREEFPNDPIMTFRDIQLRMSSDASYSTKLSEHIQNLKGALNRAEEPDLDSDPEVIPFRLAAFTTLSYMKWTVAKGTDQHQGAGTEDNISGPKPIDSLARIQEESQKFFEKINQKLQEADRSSPEYIRFFSSLIYYFVEYCLLSKRNDGGFAPSDGADVKVEQLLLGFCEGRFDIDAAYAERMGSAAFLQELDEFTLPTDLTARDAPRIHDSIMLGKLLRGDGSSARHHAMRILHLLANAAAASNRNTGPIEGLCMQRAIAVLDRTEIE